MNKEEIIRPIQPADNNAIALIIRKVLQSFKADKPGTAYFDKNLFTLFENFSCAGAAYWVVEKEGEVIGGGGIYPTSGLPPGYCEIVKLYLTDAARGKGIGTKILKQCIDTAAVLGYTYLYLETMPELYMAIPLYEKMGFIKVNCPLGKSGHHDCTIWMVKKI